MTRVVGLLLLGIAIACGSKAREDEVDPKAAEGFARALEAAAAEVGPAESAALLAQGAFETIAPSEKCLESFAAATTGKARVEALLDCGMACTLEAVQKLKGKDPRQWMGQLAAACEPSHFGLDKTSAELLSPEWFLLHKVGQLAAPHLKAAAGPAKARLEQAMAAFRLPLPLPALGPGVGDLPLVPAAATAPIAPRTFVVMPAMGALRVGATPRGTLTAGGAAIAVSTGAGFPGAEAARGDLRALVLEAAGAPPGEEPAEAAAPPPDAAPPAADAGAARPMGQYTMKRGGDDAALARRQAIENARAAGILGAISKSDQLHGLGSLALIGRPPGLHGEVTRELPNDLAGSGEPVPLLLADIDRPAVEVIEVAVSLRRVFIAVTSAEDPGVRALAVRLEANTHSAGRTPGDLHIRVRRGGGLENSNEAGGSQETVIIEPEGDARWGEVVMVAAAVIERGGKTIIFTTSAVGPAVLGVGSGPGGGGQLLGHGAYGQGKPALTLFKVGPPETSGVLDENVIQRIVRSRAGAIRACYERELVGDPKLAGRVDVEFSIAVDGRVTSVKATGLGKVSDCVARQVERMKFPTVEGGGQVKVRYPFTFAPRNE